MHEDNFTDVNTPEYSYVFYFESNYSYVNTQKWLRDNLWYCLGYDILCFFLAIGGIYYMLDKPKYNLKRLFALWCGSMALFSIIGFSRTAPELFFALGNRSLYHSVCISSNYLENSVSGFWTWALVLLKIVQLFDMIFIVLQKQRLAYLHIFHHVSAIPFLCFAYLDTTAAMRWYSVIQYFTDFCVYSYYTLKAMNIKLPICFAIINAIQILRMLIGHIITNMANNYQDTYKVDCYITYQIVVAGFAYHITSGYFYIKFFSESYEYEKQDAEDRKID